MVFQESSNICWNNSQKFFSVLIQRTRYQESIRLVDRFGMMDSLLIDLRITFNAHIFAKHAISETLIQLPHFPGESSASSLLAAVLSTTSSVVAPSSVTQQVSLSIAHSFCYDDRLFLIVIYNRVYFIDFFATFLPLLVLFQLAYGSTSVYTD